MTRRILHTIRKYDPIYMLCDSLFGEDHGKGRRMIVGLVVMTTGVTIAKVATYLNIHNEFIHFFADEFGYMIHAIGATPYIETLVVYSAAVKKAITVTTAAAEIVE